jgi:hypothetical protein
LDDGRRTGNRYRVGGLCRRKTGLKHFESLQDQIHTLNQVRETVECLTGAVELRSEVLLVSLVLLFTSGGSIEDYLDLSHDRA